MAVTVGAHATGRGVNGRPIANRASDRILLLTLSTRSIAAHTDANAFLFVREAVRIRMVSTAGLWALREVLLG